MGMAILDPPLRWDSEHIVEVKMCYVRSEGTQTEQTYLGPAPSIYVCKKCRSSREVCRCAWRKPAR